MRAAARFSAPVVSAITTSPRCASGPTPGVDVHLIIHPESETEVRSIAPTSEVVCVRGLTDPAFYEPLEIAQARAAFDIPESGRVVLVSGGGWAVGDLAGAAEVAARGRRDDRDLSLCRNEEVRAELIDRLP